MGINFKEVTLLDFKQISRKTVWIKDMNGKEHYIPSKSFKRVRLGVCAIDEELVSKLGINKKDDE